MPIAEYYTKLTSQIESEAATGADDTLELEKSENAQEEQEDEMDIKMDYNGDNFTKKIKTLKVILTQNKKNISAYEYLKYHSVYELLINWKKI